MLAAGMLIVWTGYSLTLWGWCLIRGYDVTLGQLMSPMHPYGSGKGQPWPPKPIGDDVVFPGGRAASAAANANARAAPPAAPSNKLPGTNRPLGQR